MRRNDIKLALLGDHEAAKRLTGKHEPVPCPWCGGKQTAVSDVIWPQVKCEKCGARGPRACDTLGACLSWNTRRPILSEREMEMLEGLE